MARTATLKFDKKSFSTEFVKVDRKKLYGWSKIVVSDKDNGPCSTASIADGSHILPSKSTTLQGFNENGEYISRSNLIGVDSDNNVVEKVPSTYDVDSNLEISSLDDYLSLNVKSVYQLNIVENKEQLLDILNDGTILTFPFNYRADYEADDAFIISSNEHIFAVVGKQASFEFIGLENKEEEIVELEEEQTTEDEFDFGML